MAATASCIDILYVHRYAATVEFEWDEQKRQTNIDKHGIDFEDARSIFGDVRITAVDDRQAYGEIRKITIGKIDGRICVVVYTVRGGMLRFISARKANQRERRKFYEHIERAKSEENR